MDKAAAVMLQLYSSVGQATARVEMTTSWVLLAFDREREGLIPLQSFKVRISVSEGVAVGLFVCSSPSPSRYNLINK